MMMIMVMMIMMFTGNAGILGIPAQEFFNHLINIARVAADHLYAMMSQRVERALSHISGQHCVNSYLSQGGSNIRFAPATLGGWQNFGFFYFVLVVNGQDGIYIALAKVVLYHVSSCWNRNFHLVSVFIEFNDIFHGFRSLGNNHLDVVFLKKFNYPGTESPGHNRLDTKFHQVIN